jgi:hypothetical protein
LSFSSYRTASKIKLHPISHVVLMGEEQQTVGSSGESRAENNWDVSVVGAVCTARSICNVPK